MLSLQRALLPGHTERCRIELHEGVIDGAVLGMTGITGRRGWKLLAGCRRVGEAVKRPFTVILDVRLDGHQAALRTAGLVDRGVRLRRADFENKYRFVRPSARIEE